MYSFHLYDISIKASFEPQKIGWLYVQPMANLYNQLDTC